MNMKTTNISRYQHFKLYNIFYEYSNPYTVVFVADDYFYKWTAYKSQIERKKLKIKSYTDLLKINSPYYFDLHNI